MKAYFLPNPVRLLLIVLLAIPGCIFQSAVAKQAAAGIPPAPRGAAQAALTTISLGETIAIDGEGAAAGDRGVIISSAGTFRFNGTLADGMIYVSAPGAAVELILAGASVTNSDGPAIMVSDAEATTVTLEAGTSNTLTDGGDTEFDAALFSTPPLTIRGEGELTVAGNQEEGIESPMHVFIEGGTIRVHAVEDGLNANTDDLSQIHITGGHLFVESETGDGIDSNGSLTITGGTVISQGASVNNSGGLDADGPVTVDGGIVIATGAYIYSPVQDSAQRSILVAYGHTQAAGTLVVIRHDFGHDMLVFRPSIDYEQLLFSDAGITEGETYTVYTGGTPTGEAVDGLYFVQAADPGTEVMRVTTIP
jgi:hypothetical protein